jgi:hypothetical protein
LVHVLVLQKVEAQKMLQEIDSELAEVETLVQYILFALEENAIHRHSNAMDPSTAPNPHRFGPSTDIPHRHCRQEEKTPHLHTGDNESKA